LNYGQSLNIIGFFSFTYLKNTGVSFGLFKGSNFLFAIIAFLALVFFIYVYLKKKKYFLQLSLITAGISGNLIDRIFLGHVVDFIDFHYWPVFNVADSAISIGMIWLLVLLIKNKEDLI
jgi:signal peptidase II